MIKKLILLAVSAAALVAFAVPAAAQADPIVTGSSGGAATEVTAVSENTKLTTTSGVLECKTTDFAIILMENNTETAYGYGTGTAQGNPHFGSHIGHCTSSTGATVSVTKVTVFQFDLRPGSTGTSSFSYAFDIGSTPFIFHCTLNGTTNVTRSNGGNTMTISGSLSGPGPFPCPASGTIHGSFKVTDAGGTVVFHG